MHVYIAEYLERINKNIFKICKAVNCFLYEICFSLKCVLFSSKAFCQSYNLEYCWYFSLLNHWLPPHSLWSYKKLQTNLTIQKIILTLNPLSRYWPNSSVSVTIQKALSIWWKTILVAVLCLLGWFHLEQNSTSSWLMLPLSSRIIWGKQEERIWSTRQKRRAMNENANVLPVGAFGRTRAGGNAASTGGQWRHRWHSDQACGSCKGHCYCSLLSMPLCGQQTRVSGGPGPRCLSGEQTASFSAALERLTKNLSLDKLIFRNTSLAWCGNGCFFQHNIQHSIFTIHRNYTQLC